MQQKFSIHEHMLKKYEALIKRRDLARAAKKSMEIMRLNAQISLLEQLMADVLVFER